MTISVLSQASVDNLRMLVKRGEAILEQSFEDILVQYNLQLIEIDVNFDDSIELLLPEGENQNNNNDAKNCILISSALLI